MTARRMVLQSLRSGCPRIKRFASPAVILRTRSRVPGSVVFAASYACSTLGEVTPSRLTSGGQKFERKRKGPWNSVIASFSSALP